MAEDLRAQELIAQGWSVFDEPGFVSLAGPFLHRMGEDGPTFRFPVSDKHENRNGMLQGGALMTFVDRALGATARALTDTPATVTVTLTVQFIDGVKIGEMVEITPTMTRATKQLVFMSGVCMAGSRVVCVANGVWKKIATPAKVAAALQPGTG